MAKIIQLFSIFFADFLNSFKNSLQMPKTKSGFKNWQRIIALFLVFIFSVEQVSYAGRLDDAYSSIKSSLKSSVSSVKTSYNSWTQSNRANYPNAFKVASPLIAGLDLARSAVTRTPPAFYNSWTAGNRQALPNAARAYDTNGPFGAAFYSVGLVTNPVIEKVTGIKAGSAEAKASLQSLHKWIPAPVNLAIKASIGKDLDNPYASTKQGYDKITSITPKEAVIGALEVGFPLIGKGVSSLIKYADISSTSLGLGATSTYITTKVFLPITKYAIESPLVRATAKTALKQGMLWGGFNVASDVGISLITGHQLTTQELTKSFGIGFASGVAFTGGTAVLGKVLTWTSLAAEGSWAAKIGQQAAKGELKGLSRLKEWGASAVRKAENFGTAEGITALPALSWKGVKGFAGASLVFTPVGALVNYGFNKDVTQFNQAISLQSFATNAIYMGLGSGTLKYDQTAGTFVQDLGQGFRFNNRGGAFWGPAIGVTSLPTSVFTGSTSRIAQAIEVNAMSPGLRGVVDTFKVLSGKVGLEDISKTLLYRAANPSLFWNTADHIFATSSVGAWLGITENVALKLGASPETASNIAFVSLFFKPAPGANQMLSETAGVHLDALEKKKVDVFKLKPGTFSAPLTKAIQEMKIQKLASKSYEAAHREAKKNGLNLRIDPISSGQINANLRLEKSPFVVIGENPGKLDILGITDPATGKMEFVSSPKGKDSLKQHLEVLQQTLTSKEESPYAVLKVKTGVTLDEANTAYRKEAFKAHSDTSERPGGDTDRFIEITQAKKKIEAVSASPETKMVYDSALKIKDFLNGNGVAEKLNNQGNSGNPNLKLLLSSAPSLQGAVGEVKEIANKILPMTAAASEEISPQPASLSLSEPSITIPAATFNVHTGANILPPEQSSIKNTPFFVRPSPVQSGGAAIANVITVPQQISSAEVPSGVRSYIGQMSQVQFRNNFAMDMRINGRELDALANNSESRVDRSIELGFNQHELQQRLGGRPVLFENNKLDSPAKPAEAPKVDSGKLTSNIEAIKPVILNKPVLGPVIVPINGKDLTIPQRVIETLFKDKAKITQFNTLPEMKVEQKFEGKDGQVFVLRSQQDSKIKFVTKIIAKYNLNISAKDEFDITGRLKSNNVRVPTIYDLEKKNNILFMEFIEGQKLRDFLKQPHPQEALNEIAGKIGVEIWKMHEAGVVHRDLHDQNIMVNDKGDPTFIDLSRSAFFDKTNFEERFRELDRATDGMKGRRYGRLEYNKEFPVNTILDTYTNLYIEKYGVDEFIKGLNKEIYEESHSYNPGGMPVVMMKVALYLKMQAAKKILLEDIPEIKGNPAEIDVLNNNFLKAEELLKTVSNAMLGVEGGYSKFRFHDKAELLRFEYKMFDNIMSTISLSPQTKKLIENRLGLPSPDNTRKTGLSGVIQTIQKLLEPKTELEKLLADAFKVKHRDQLLETVTRGTLQSATLDTTIPPAKFDSPVKKSLEHMHMGFPITPEKFDRAMGKFFKGVGGVITRIFDPLNALNPFSSLREVRKFVNKHPKFKQNEQELREMTRGLDRGDTQYLFSWVENNINIVHTAEDVRGLLKILENNHKDMDSFDSSKSLIQKISTLSSLQGIKEVIHSVQDLEPLVEVIRGSRDISQIQNLLFSDIRWQLNTTNDLKPLVEIYKIAGDKIEEIFKIAVLPEVKGSIHKFEDLKPLYEIYKMAGAKTKEVFEIADIPAINEKINSVQDLSPLAEVIRDINDISLIKGLPFDSIKSRISTTKDLKLLPELQNISGNIKGVFEIANLPEVKNLTPKFEDLKPIAELVKNNPETFGINIVDKIRYAQNSKSFNANRPIATIEEWKDSMETALLSIDKYSEEELKGIVWTEVRESVNKIFPEMANFVNYYGHQMGGLNASRYDGRLDNLIKARNAIVDLPAQIVAPSGLLYSNRYSILENLFKNIRSSDISPRVKQIETAINEHSKVLKDLSGFALGETVIQNIFKDSDIRARAKQIGIIVNEHPKLFNEILKQEDPIREDILNRILKAGFMDLTVKQLEPFILSESGLFKYLLNERAVTAHEHEYYFLETKKRILKDIFNKNDPSMRIKQIEAEITKSPKLFNELFKGETGDIDNDLTKYRNKVNYEIWDYLLRNEDINSGVGVTLAVLGRKDEAIKTIHEISDLEPRLSVLNEIALLSFESIPKGLFDQNVFDKFILLKKEKIPSLPSIIEKYLDVEEDHVGYLNQIKRDADLKIKTGFDYTNQHDLELAFFGAARQGINMDFEQFKARVDNLAKFDQAHPGYFNSLFKKGSDLPTLSVSAQTSQSFDTSKVNSQVLNTNLKELVAIKDRVDSLAWLEDFPQNKVLNLRNLYYQAKREEALKSGSIKEGQKFRIDFPQEQEMRDYLKGNKLLYTVIFKLTKDRLNQKDLQDKYLTLMRDTIVSDTLLDTTLVNVMGHADIMERITAFKNFYEDYKNHLPNSLGMKVENIKGLSAKFEDLSKNAYEEIGKVAVVKTKDGSAYTLVPQGFPSVFRGRAGMMDCSFDEDKGKPYTRAMQEDTDYYFVYKGKELKGYVGLLKARDENNRPILTIDTVNSPDFNGKELLSNLFRELDKTAKGLGYIGIALPKYLWASFNFNNKETIEEMPEYKKAVEIKVEPMHKESWELFTKEYGADTYNSIEKGEFKLLNAEIKSIETPKLDGVFSGLHQKIDSIDKDTFVSEIKDILIKFPKLEIAGVGRAKRSLGEKELNRLAEISDNDFKFIKDAQDAKDLEARIFALAFPVSGGAPEFSTAGMMAIDMLEGMLREGSWNSILEAVSNEEVGVHLRNLNQGSMPFVGSHIDNRLFTIHEKVEILAMSKGATFQEAHKIALEFERRFRRYLLGPYDAAGVALSLPTSSAEIIGKIINNTKKGDKILQLVKTPKGELTCLIADEGRDRYFNGERERANGYELLDLIDVYAGKDIKKDSAFEDYLRYYENLLVAITISQKENEKSLLLQELNERYFKPLIELMGFDIGRFLTQKETHELALAILLKKNNNKVIDRLKGRRQRNTNEDYYGYYDSEEEKLMEMALPQIGKLTEVLSVEGTIVKVKDSKGNPHTFALDASPVELNLLSLKSQLENILQDKDAHKELLSAILSRFEKSPPELRAFDTLIEDLLGFALPQENRIALHKSLKDNPVAIFHELAELLIQQKALNLKLKDTSLIVTLDNKEFNLPLKAESLAIAQKDPANPHYLLRALQREVFKEKDRDLTENIKSKPAGKTATKVSRTEAVRPVGSDRVDAAILPVEGKTTSSVEVKINNLINNLLAKIPTLLKPKSIKNPVSDDIITDSLEVGKRLLGKNRNLIEVIRELTGLDDASRWKVVLEDVIKRQFEQADYRPFVEPITNSLDAIAKGNYPKEVNIIVRDNYVSITDQAGGMNLGEMMAYVVVPKISGNRGKEGAVAQFGVGFYSLLNLLKKPGEELIVRSFTSASQDGYELVYTYKDNMEIENLCVTVRPLKNIDRKQGTGVLIKSSFNPEMVIKAIKEALSYNQRAKIYVDYNNQKILINDLSPFRLITAENAQALVQETVFNEHPEVVLTIMGVKIFSIPLTGKNIPERLAVELSEPSLVPRARNQIEVNAKARALVKGLIEEILARADWRAINSLVPLLTRLDEENKSSEDKLLDYLDKRLLNLAKENNIVFIPDIDKLQKAEEGAILIHPQVFLKLITLGYRPGLKKYGSYSIFYTPPKKADSSNLDNQANNNIEWVPNVNAEIYALEIQDENIGLVLVNNDKLDGPIFLLNKKYLPKTTIGGIVLDTLIEFILGQRGDSEGWDANIKMLKESIGNIPFAFLNSASYIKGIMLNTYKDNGTLSIDQIQMPELGILMEDSVSSKSKAAPVEFSLSLLPFIISEINTQGHSADIPTLKEVLEGINKGKIFINPLGHKYAERDIQTIVDQQNIAPYINFRENGQNSRDEAVRQGKKGKLDIKVEISEDKKRIILKFEDDFGMDAVKLIQFLINPGASDKRQDQRLTGRFGQGFFTNLKDAEEVRVKTSLGDYQVVYASLNPIRNAKQETTDIKVSILRKLEKYKGTEVEVILKVEGDSEVTVSHILEKAALYLGLIDKNILEITLNGALLNKGGFAEKDLLAQVDTAYGKLSFYHYPDRRAVTHKQLYVTILNEQYVKAIPSLLLEILLKHGIIIDLPDKLELISDRSGLTLSDEKLKEMEKATFVTAVMAAARLYIDGLKEAVELFPYDFDSPEQLSSWSARIPDDVRKDLQNIQAGNWEKLDIEKYSQDKDKLVYLISMFPVYNGMSITELIIGIVTGKLSIEEIPLALRMELQRKRAELMSKIHGNSGGKISKYEDEDITELSPFNPDILKNYPEFAIYSSLAEFLSKTASLLLGKEIKVMLTADLKNGALAYTWRDSDVIVWNLAGMNRRVEQLSRLLKGTMQIDEPEAKELIGGLILGVSHEATHIPESIGRLTHNADFKTRTIELMQKIALGDNAQKIAKIIDALKNPQANFAPTSVFTKKMAEDMQTALRFKHYAQP